MQKLLIIFLITLTGFSYSLFAHNPLPKILNLISWADYIQPEILQQFEAETGIKVKVDYVDSHYALESKIISSRQNYDVTVPMLAPFFIRQVQFGLFQKIDHQKLKNYRNIDPIIINLVHQANNSDQYSIPFMVDTIGLGYNLNKLKAIDDNLPLNSLDLIFDTKYLSKIASCGVEILDSSEEIIALAHIYLGLDPNLESEENLKKVSALLAKIRPFISSINNALYFTSLANADSCLVVGYSGDIIQAKLKALSFDPKSNINFILPSEGSVMTLDLMAIPTDAPHIDNAYLFLDFIMRPEINAAIANHIGFTSPNKASYPLIRHDLINNPNIYPFNYQKHQKIVNLNIPSIGYNRLRNRLWMKFLSNDLD